MANLTKPKPQLNSHLRVVRDEDAPPYDAVPSPKLAGGFAMIPARVFELNDGAALAVFAVLAKHANQNGACWPSMNRLETMLGWTETRIRPALKTLIESGVIVVEKRRLNGMDQSNIYRILPEVQVPHHKGPVPHSKVLGTSTQGSGYLTTRDERETVELQPEEQESTGDRKISAKTKRPEYTPEFKAFAAQYPKGRGSLKDAFAIWKELDDEDRADAMASLPAFKAGRDWQEGYQPGPEVWLRGRRWENPPAPYKPTVVNEHPNAARHGKWVG